MPSPDSGFLGNPDKNCPQRHLLSEHGIYLLSRSPSEVSCDLSKSLGKRLLSATEDGREGMGAPGTGAAVFYNIVLPHSVDAMIQASQSPRCAVCLLTGGHRGQQALGPSMLVLPRSRRLNFSPF